MTAKTNSAQEFLKDELNQLDGNVSLQAKLQEAANKVYSRLVTDQLAYKRALKTSPTPLNTVINNTGNLQARYEALKSPDLLPIYDELPLRLRYIVREFEQRLIADRLDKVQAERARLDQAFARELILIKSNNTIEPGAPSATEWLTTMPTDQIEVVDTTGLDQHSLIRSTAFTPRPLVTEPVEDVGSVDAAAASNIHKLVDAIPDRLESPHQVFVVTEETFSPAPQPRAKPDFIANPPVTLTEVVSIPNAAPLPPEEVKPVLLTEAVNIAEAPAVEPKPVHVEEVVEAVSAAPSRWSYATMADRLDKIEEGLKGRTGDNLFVFTRDILIPEHRAAQAELLAHVAAGTRDTPEAQAIADYSLSLRTEINRAKAALSPDATRVEAFHARLKSQEKPEQPSLFARATGLFSGLAASVTEFAEFTFGKDKTPAPAVVAKHDIPEDAADQMAFASGRARVQLAEINIAKPEAPKSFGERFGSFLKSGKNLVSGLADTARTKSEEAFAGVSRHARAATVGLGIAAAVGIGASAINVLSTGDNNTSPVAKGQPATTVVAKTDAKAETAPKDTAAPVIAAAAPEAKEEAPAPKNIVIGKADIPAPTVATLLAQKAPAKAADQVSTGSTRSTFSAAAKTVETYKAPDSIQFTFNDGSTSRFGKDTWQKACDQLKANNLDAVICNDPALKQG